MRRYYDVTPDETEDALDSLVEVLEQNFAQNGQLETYDLPDIVDDNDPALYQDEEDEADGPVDETGAPDLKSDFDWHYFEDMTTHGRPWPIHDSSLLVPQSAIYRYLSDYLMYVASEGATLKRVASGLRKLVK